MVEPSAGGKIRSHWRQTVGCWTEGVSWNWSRSDTLCSQTRHPPVEDRVLKLNGKPREQTNEESSTPMPTGKEGEARLLLAQVRSNHDGWEAEAEQLRQQLDRVLGPGN